MKTSDIYKLINQVKAELRADYNNKSNIDINNHSTNANLITENGEAVLDEAVIVEENSESLLDIADLIADLEERVSALENQ